MIVIDTNILLAFLLTNGITRRIVTENPDIFMSPEHCFEELWEHRDRWNKNKLPDSELLEIVNDVKRLFVIGRGVAAMRSLINQSYLNLYVHSIERQILELGTGSTFPNVQGEVLGTINIPISPLPEQQEIVRRIELLFKFADETEKNAGEARKRVEFMTQSILARAFRGDLSADFREAVRNWKDLDAEARGRYVFVLPEEEREKVLSADEFPIEPASRLLERIGEERAKQESSKRCIKRLPRNKIVEFYKSNRR